MSNPVTDCYEDITKAEISDSDESGMEADRFTDRIARALYVYKYVDEETMVAGQRFILRHRRKIIEFCVILVYCLFPSLLCCYFLIFLCRRIYGSFVQRSVEDETFDKVDSEVSSIEGNNRIVGFDDEARGLLDELVGGWKKLQVVSVTGMGGIGKTTLAYLLYENSSIVNHFHLRAWSTMSRFCAKRKLLQGILSCILHESDPIFTQSTEDMEEKLYKSLKGKRYLIVLDDIWESDAWNDVKNCFPEDGNGSRILVTTRIKDVALSLGPSYPPHSLRFLSEDESWDLFKHKVFAGKRFPEELIGMGKQIVANCKCLPLAIVVIAGILSKEEKTMGFWGKVCQNVGSIMCSESEKFMDILALSYEHLPPSLKSCFLYAGSFAEDYEIPVTRLIRSWIAEGFIRYDAEKSLEDVAENYLTDLINRNLVMVVKTRADGAIKSCRMHDMLRDLCLKKTKENELLQLICKCGGNNSCTPSSFRDCQHFHFYNLHFVYENLVFNKETNEVFKLLRTLDLRHINLDSFPESVVQLIRLRYLGLRVNQIESLPPSIFRLLKLKTFILDGGKGGKVTLTAHIFKMTRLMHFVVSREIVFDKKWARLFRKYQYKHENSFPSRRHDEFRPILYQLQTISHLNPSGAAGDLLVRCPNLRKLGLHLTISETSNVSFVSSSISKLFHLEKLKFEYQTLGMIPFSLPHMFPQGLKQLTLIGSHVKWTEISTIGFLPNLEVLKIKDNFFSGPLWETTEGGFRSLKFLKLSHMDLKRWVSSSSHFPRLEWIVINGCLDLEEIPSEMGDILTMRIIEVYRSSDSTVESAFQIQEAQRCMCNDEFKVLIYQHFQEY